MNEAARAFWDWFKENNRPYLTVGEINFDEKENLLGELETRLHRYCDQLFFQIGGTPGESQELIITAEGDTKFFSQVEELINSAPIIENWTFISFIPSDELDYTVKLNFEDIELCPAEIWFLPLNSSSNPQSIGIKICVPNYQSLRESTWFESAVFKLLDLILGEKSFALDVDFIDYGELPLNPESYGMIELHELRRFLGWKKTKLNRP